MEVKLYESSGRTHLPVPDGSNLHHGRSAVFVYDHGSIILMSLHEYRRNHKHLKHFRSRVNSQFTVDDKPASRTKWMKSQKVAYL